MPEYAGKSYPYTPEGIAAYEKAKAADKNAKAMPVGVTRRKPKS
jgi:hypothetical protein